MKKVSLIICLFTTIIFTSEGMLYADSASIPKEVPKSADISLNGVYLDNSASSTKVLGKNIPLKEEEGLPFFGAYNRDKTQFAKFIRHYGSMADSFSEFSVKNRNRRINRSTRALDVGEFVTGKNIKLGITKDDLVKILGDRFKSKKDGGILVLNYKIDSEGSKFLQHYNMPMYYGTYKFKGDKLIEFSFGFEYP